MNKTDMNNSKKGVTLVELLVAVAITVVVGGSVVGSLLSGRSAFKSGDAITFKNENARGALDFIGRDISAAFIFIPGQHDPEFYFGDQIIHYGSYDDHGNPSGSPITDDTLHFTAIIDATDEEHELRLIRYWLTGDNEIKRYEERLLHPQPVVELLIENVTNLYFEFLSDEVSGNNPEWYGDWDFYHADDGTAKAAHQRGRIPRAVRITVEVTDRNGENPEEFSTLIHLPMSTKDISL
jgi:prepilin-type N-terminal cleavage/methylation domain-containing protein